MASTSQTTGAAHSKSYEVADFFSVAPNKDYVLVSHYRAVQREGGHTVNEPVVAVEELVARMIGAFEGHSVPVAQGLRGIFKENSDARQCADAIAAHHGKQTEVVGNEVLVFL